MVVAYANTYYGLCFQDGLFDGLVHLERLSFANNKISFVGNRLFSNRSDLTSLLSIELRGNQLQSVDAWPFIRAEVAAGVYVGLSENQGFSSFSNSKNWSYNASVPMKININVSYANVTSFKKLFSALNFSSEFDIFDFQFHTQVPHSRRWDYGFNPYRCDCSDYIVWRFLLLARGIDAPFKKLYCPLSFFPFYRPIDLPLDYLICDAEENCPNQCECTNQPAKSSFNVKCKLTSNLPAPLPPVTAACPWLYSCKREKYNLNFSQSSIAVVSSRYYLNRTRVLDVSSSKVTNISTQAMEVLLDVQELYLHDNLLTTLPSVVLRLNLSLNVLSIYNNPFACSCEHAWLKTWLYSLTKEDRLEKTFLIQCYSPAHLKDKTILSIDEYEFCHAPNNWSNSITISVTTAATALWFLIMSATALKCRLRIFKATGIHPFDRDECEGEDMEYDFFLSCANEDNETARLILMFLERHSCRGCFHERDFMFGLPNAENFTRAISRSKRTLCLVSNNFMRSHFCLEEFHLALARNVELGKQRIYVIVLDDSVLEFPDSGESEEIILMLKNFVTSHNYMSWNPEVFATASNELKDRLLYAMPIHRLGWGQSV